MFEALGADPQDPPVSDPSQKEISEPTRTKDKEPLEVAGAKDLSQEERESERVKDNHALSDMESQGSKESEKGEIGDSNVTVRRSARRRMSTREERKRNIQGQIAGKPTRLGKDVSQNPKDGKKSGPGLQGRPSISQK